MSYLPWIYAFTIYSYWPQRIDNEQSARGRFAEMLSDSCVVLGDMANVLAMKLDS